MASRRVKWVGAKVGEWKEIALTSLKVRYGTKHAVFACDRYVTRPYSM